MAKILLGIILLCILALIIFAMMCAMIIAGRSDKTTCKQDIKGTGEVFIKKQLCQKCKTGKETYKYDKSSFECPYILMHDGEKCAKFIEIDKK